MKKVFIIIISVFVATAMLTSCSWVNSHTNSTETNQPDTYSDENNITTQYNAETEPSTQQEIIKMDINSYMTYFVNYFHEPYNVKDGIEDDDILSLLFFFCYSNREMLEFVEMNEATQTMYIDGEGLREVAKMLLGDSFNPTEYHDYFNSGETADKYLAGEDTYIVPTAKGYWGGDLFYLEFGAELKITETDTEASVIAGVYEGDNPAVKMEYKFKKVVDGGFLYYQIKEVSLAK